MTLHLTAPWMNGRCGHPVARRLRSSLPTACSALPLACSVLVLAALSACGGGGGSAEPTPVDPTPASLQITGTAAVGRALAAAPVAAKCSSGSGSATTATDGRFSLPIVGGVLPCVLQVATADGMLHSVATGSGASATANISPLTDLVLAQAAGGDAATLFAGFDAAAQAKVAPAALAAAITSVQTALQSVISLDGVNPFTDALVAATAGAAGNGLDAKLDTLAAKLAAAKLSLPDLRAAIVKNGAAAKVVVAAQVQPAAAHCASLRSGPYVMVNPNETEDQYRVRKVVVDAVALTALQPDGTVDAPAVPVAGKPCHFSADGGRSNFIVSPAGVIINHYLANDGSNTARIAIGLPLQTIAPAELAGTWNTVELGRDNGADQPAVNSYANVVVDAAGKLTTINDCKYLLPCAPSGGVVAGFSANPDGGFNTLSDGGEVGRFFAYRAASGDLMLIGLVPSGVIVGTRQTALSLPTEGSTVTYWDVAINSQGVAGNLIGDVRTYTAVDAATGTYSRSPSFSGNTDSFAINLPRPGMRIRETCRSATGVVTACGLISLPLTGMGITVHGSSRDTFGSNFLDIGVVRPAGSTSTGVQAVGPAAAQAAALGTLVVTGGETYPLRASFTIDGNGLINGGQYDFHKLSGTMTPCTYSQDNAAVCFGTSAGFNLTSQGGVITTQGSASAISLRAGPDVFGYTYTGTLTGTVWTGTWTRAADGAPNLITQSGSFSVSVSITGQ